MQWLQTMLVDSLELVAEGSGAEGSGAAGIVVDVPEDEVARADMFEVEGTCVDKLGVLCVG